MDTENNVLQHYLASDLVQLGLWGNVVEKNMRVKVRIRRYPLRNFIFKIEIHSVKC